MQYQGPTRDDLENVFALNRYFLYAAESPATAGASAPAAARLSAAQRARISTAPFLLFSLREQDVGLWEQLLSQDPQRELVATDTTADVALQELTVAALSFLWELSRRNAYTARMVSGAPVVFCDKLASSTLVDLLRRAATRVDLLVPRYRIEDQIWGRMLNGSAGRTRQLQTMSQQSALQRLLTLGQLDGHEELPAAAARFATQPKRRTARR